MMKRSQLIALTLPNVVGASRRIETDGLATSREGSFGVSIIGIEPELEAPLSVLSKNVVSGEYPNPVMEILYLLEKDSLMS